MKRPLSEDNAYPSSIDSDEEDSDGKRDRVKRAPRLGLCEVCAAKNAVYSCPKCEVKTCCLACVRIHKKELSCDGIRDRTKFIALRNMTKADFMSDYYFLEECTRYVADRKSDQIKRFTRFNKVLPTHLFRLRNAAAERNIKLRFLLQNFSRHKENTTYYDWKERKIYWRIEWIFVNASAGLKYVDKRCSEDNTLHKLLDKYVNPESLELVPKKMELELYQSVGLSGIKVFLKAEGIKRSRSRYYALDITKSLKDNLTGKTLVEYPYLYISCKKDPEGFDIIADDEDVEAEAKAYEASLEQVRTKEEAPVRSATASSMVDEKSRRRDERRQKRKEFEKAPNNYLFTDENLWDMFSTSSSSDNGNDTEEEADLKT